MWLARLCLQGQGSVYLAIYPACPGEMKEGSKETQVQRRLCCWSSIALHCTKGFLAQTRHCRALFGRTNYDHLFVDKRLRGVTVLDGQLVALCLHDPPLFPPHGPPSPQQRSPGVWWDGRCFREEYWMRNHLHICALTSTQVDIHPGQPPERCDSRNYMCSELYLHVALYQYDAREHDRGCTRLAMPSRMTMSPYKICTFHA